MRRPAGRSEGLRAVIAALALASCAKHARPHPHATTNASIQLTVGQAVSIPTEGLREYGVDGQELIVVRRTPEALVVSALRPGTTAIYLVDADGNVARREVRIGVPAARTRGDELAEELSAFRCVRVTREGALWAITATPTDDTERLQLEELKESYATQDVILRLVPDGCAVPAAASPDGGRDDAG